LLQKAANRIADGLEFTDRPDRFLYGSDWPLAPMAVYRDFVRRIVPQPWWQAVFEDNARALFGLDGSA
jgi:predicted TIM-barrel fold metal-dependent hydrolase